MFRIFLIFTSLVLSLKYNLKFGALNFWNLLNGIYKFFLGLLIGKNVGRRESSAKAFLAFKWH